MKKIAFISLIIAGAGAIAARWLLGRDDTEIDSVPTYTDSIQQNEPQSDDRLAA